METSFNTCGVPYRILADGRVEVQGTFPEYTESQVLAKISKIWADFGGTIIEASRKWNLQPAWLVGIIYIESGGNPKAAAACEPKYCPALWNRGACEAQGGPEKYCAGGLMAFISGTAALFGKTMTYFIEHPDEMIFAAAELIAVGGPGRNVYGGGIQGKNGDVLSVVKMYNGGSPCGGGGITGHGGQADYVSKFVKVCNAFVSLGLQPSPSKSFWGPRPELVLLWAALGAVGYYLLDKQYRLTERASAQLGSLV